MIEQLIIKNSSLYCQHLIGKARHSLLMARQKELAPNHVSPRQANVMFIIYNLGHKATLAEIAKYTGRGVSSISIQLTRMEKDGLVKKSREIPKSVQLSFQLTEKGTKIYKTGNKMTAYRAIFAKLTEEERQLLITTLKKVIDESDKYQAEAFK